MSTGLLWLNFSSVLTGEITMRKFMALTIASLGLVLFGSSSFAYSAPGYSCLTANHSVEIAICESRKLSRLDRSLNYWYSRAKERARYFGQVKWLRRTQLSWLRSKNACSWNRFCLRSKYKERIRDLRNYTLHV